VCVCVRACVCVCVCVCGNTRCRTKARARRRDLAYPRSHLNMCRGRSGALASDGRAPSGLLHSSDLLPWKKSHALVTQCVRVRACKNPRRGREETRWCLFVLTDMSPCYRNSPIHTKSKDQERTLEVLCVLITLLVDLTKSACMHKHAKETRAGAGISDSCSRLNAATDAAAQGRAFPASRQALQAPLRCRRQHTELDNTNTPDKEDKARAQCEAPHCCV